MTQSCWGILSSK